MPRHNRCEFFLARSMVCRGSAFDVVGWASPAAWTGEDARPSIESD